MKQSQETLNTLNRLAGLSLVVGAVGLGVGAIAWFVDPRLFFRSYLIAFLFWVGVGVGSLALLMLQHMVGGGWGLVIRRILEASTRTLPVLALLFIPVLLGVGSLYEWSHGDVVASDEILQHKAGYLNVPFWAGRAVLYFLVWLGLAWFLNRLSAEQDAKDDPGLVRRFQALSAPGLVAFGATVTFASVDWAMSLEPHWFSTIYGFHFMVSFGLIALAFSVYVLSRLKDSEPMKQVLRPGLFHDLGNLMLAFVMLWAYISFSQYLITWSGNLPEETPWYINRLHGGWQYVGLALILLHFALPFVLLLSRATKRRGETLAAVALLVILLRFVDLFFLVVPGLEHIAPFPGTDLIAGLKIPAWSDLALWAGVGGIWLSVFLRQLRSWALLPANDPRLKQFLDAGGAVAHG